jgi:phenylacetate-CoA ligase
LQRSVLLPAFEMSESRVRDFIKVIRRRQPRMLFGYPSALAHIAKFAESEGTRMNDLGVRVAFVTAERLYDHQRDVIARVFGCKVANGYGGRDAGFLAHECPHGGMHITAEDVILEIVDESGRNVPTGETGELVVTHLATRDFPFIRYRTSDVGALDDRQCACGRGLPLLKEIQGRTTDFIIAQDGTVMHGLALIYVVRDVTGIRSFKIIQETLDRIQLLIVPDDSFDEGVRGSIRAGFKKRLGDKVEINIEIVADIPAEASGKFRYVVSRISAHA